MDGLPCRMSSKRQIHRIGPALRRQLREKPSLDRGIGHETAELDSVGTPAPRQILDHRLPDPRSCRGVRDPRSEGLVPASLGPAGDERRRQPCRRRQVGVLVRVDRQSPCAGLRNPRDDLRRSAPDRRAQRLYVGYHSGDPRFARHLDHLVDRSCHADRVVGLVADVTCVEATELRHDPAQLDQLGILRIAARGVEGARRQPPPSGFHPGAYECTHRAELFVARRPVLTPDYAPANGAVRDQLDHVHAEPLLNQGRVLPGKIDRTAPVRVHHHRGQPLRKERFPVAQLRRRESRARMRMRVDKTGCDVEPFGVEDGFRLRTAQVTDRGDASVTEGDIGLPSGCTGSIQHLSTQQDRVVDRCFAGGQYGDEREAQQAVLQGSNSFLSGAGRESLHQRLVIDLSSCGHGLTLMVPNNDHYEAREANQATSPRQPQWGIPPAVIDRP